MVRTAKKANDYDVEEMIKNLPPGLDRAILQVLSFYKGSQVKIPRMKLVFEIKLLGITANERQVRLQISQLRKSGVLIGSAPGEDGGYYLIETVGEFHEFIAKEYLAKISDMQETLSSMRHSAQDRFGPALDAIQTSFL